MSATRLASAAAAAGCRRQSARRRRPPSRPPSPHPFPLSLPTLAPPPLQLVWDKELGRSKGFGFVSFADERDARDALNDAGGRELDGAVIKVNIAHGPAIIPGYGPGRGGRGGR